ncbi:MAG: ferredoxin [Chitinivibrionales bacterium]|nr:ferredoxin [Chitinivibrionales bacterium]
MRHPGLACGSGCAYPGEQATENGRFLKVKIHNDLCIGCEICVATCPEVFNVDGNGKVMLHFERVPAEMKQSCQCAADNCPVDAIELL